MLIGYARVSSDDQNLNPLAARPRQGGVHFQGHGAEPPRGLRTIAFWRSGSK